MSKVDKEVIKKLEKIAEERKLCEQDGHQDSKLLYISKFRGKITATYNCPICGIYTGPPTGKEYKKYEEMMHTAVTI